MDIIPKKSKMDKGFPVDTHGSRMNRKQDFLKIEWPATEVIMGSHPKQSPIALLIILFI